MYCQGSTPAYDSSDVMIIKFNSVFDTIWTKKIPWFNTFEEGIQSFVIDSTGNIVVVGSTILLESGDTVNGTTRLVVYKFDSLFNTIWRHTYDTLSHGGGTYIQVDTTNNHYWIGGVVNYHPGIYELDEDGNLLWLHEFPSDYYMQTDPMDLTILPQPYGILAYGDRLWAQLDRASYSGIIKNHNLEKEWYYAWGLSSYHPTVAVATVASDSNILISEGGGNYYADSIIPLTSMFSYIYKMTPDGKFMWRRRFFVPIDNSTMSQYPIIIDFENTPDGGFVGVGKGIDTVYFGILAKFDSLGCDGYYSCADTAMVLDLLTPVDTVCTGDTLWMNFHIDGLSAPYTVTTSMGDTINEIYHPFSPTVFSSTTLTDSTQYISYDIYVNYPFVPETSWSDTLIHLQVTVTGYYGRMLTHTYDIPVKNCSVGIAKPEIAQLNVFPNPATGGVINVEATLNEPAFLSLYDNTGKSLQTMRLEPGTHTYQIKRQLPEGMYFISIWNEKGTVVKKLIVK